MPRTSAEATAGHMDAERLVALQAGALELLRAWPSALPPVSMRLSARLTRCAGIYRPPGEITLSRHFVRQHPLPESLAVVRHELAHHIVRHTVAGRVRPHGPEFRVVAERLDAPRYAPAFDAPRTMYAYRCPACGWTWHRGRAIPKRRRYACARCAPSYDGRFRLIYLGTWRATPAAPLLAGTPPR